MIIDVQLVKQNYGSILATVIEKGLKLFDVKTDPEPD
jgi:hypothetical protein